MRQVASTVLGIVGTAGICLAQTSEIRQLERQLAESVRAGKNLDAYYAPDYLGITRTGAVRDRQAVAAYAPDLEYLLGDDVDVRLTAGGAIVTGTQQVEDTGVAVRFLRVWAKLDDGWKLVASQATAIASDTSYTAAPSSVKTQPRAAPRGRVDRTVLARDQSLLQAEAENNDAQSRALKSGDSLFVERTGAVAAASSEPRSVRLKNEIVSWDRVQAYGDFAVVQGSLLWTDVNGYTPGQLRFTRIWIKLGEEWKLGVEQRTSISD